jgi:tRNA pseudouridine55 synthase
MNTLTLHSLSTIATWYADAQEQGAVILIDKDSQWTSFDVVAKLRRILSIKKIGHAGTLDPLATGLLIVCVGRPATKHINEYQNSTKEYQATIKLGASTASFDAETPETVFSEIPKKVTTDLIQLIIQDFIGDIEQVPPMYSALKKNGIPLYRQARRGIQEEIKPRTITIQELKLIAFDGIYLTFTVQCSKGTYIRSLARDIAEKLGTVGYLTELRRISSGIYHVSDAIRISEFERAFNIATSDKSI